MLQKLKDLRLAYKVGLLPATAGLGFAMILIVSLTLGRWSANRLEQIHETLESPAEQQIVPAV